MSLRDLGTPEQIRAMVERAKAKGLIKDAVPASFVASKATKSGNAKSIWKSGRGQDRRRCHYKFVTCPECGRQNVRSLNGLLCRHSVLHGHGLKCPASNTMMEDGK